MSSGSDITPERPSAWYLFNLSMGCVGLTFMALGLGGVIIGRAGGDPIRAMDTDGMVTFLLGFAILFSMRMLFWPRTPLKVRFVVRVVISAILALNVPLSIIGLVLATQLPPTLRNASAPLHFSLLAVFCQPSALAWLMLYRHEGL